MAAEAEVDVEGEYTRRDALRRLGLTAGAAGVVWAAPAITTLDQAGAVGSAPPPPPPPPQQDVCRSQTFTTDRLGNALAFGPDRTIDVDLGAAFSSITTVTAWFVFATGGEITPGHSGGAISVHAEGSGGRIGTNFWGVPSRVLNSPQIVTRFMDGKASVVLGRDGADSFALTSMRIEVCGVLA